MVQVTREKQHSGVPAAKGGLSLLIAGVTLLVAAIALPAFDPSQSIPILSASGVAFTFGAALLCFALLRRGPAFSNRRGPAVIENLRQIVGNTAEGYAVLYSEGGSILAANSKFRDLFGLNSLGCVTCKELGFQIETVLGGEGVEATLETEIGERTFAWQRIAAVDPATNDKLQMAFGREITGERRAFEEEKAARKKAERSNVAKSRLLGTVSHDIRTPLSGISGMCHLLTQTRLSAEQRNYLAGIRQSSNALAQLVDDLLDLVSLDAGRFQLRPQDESVRSVLEGITEMLAHRAHEKGIEIASWVSSDVPAVLSFDPARLRQVLFNVIGNAVKFTHHGGVFVEARLERGKLVIRVEDSGNGMAPEEQARIFGEFEQVGTDADKSGGTGLGLAISARIIAEAGGDISVESEPRKGSTFVIRLPVELSGDFGARGSRNSVLSSSRVLVISPEGPTARALIKTIETLGGECHFAPDLSRAELSLRETAKRGTPVTDVIADHRLAAGFMDLIAQKPGLCRFEVRKIFLVNPENRTSKITGIGFDSWLVRPLRERSLVDVLLGRMKGIELRDPLNDNRSGGSQTSRFTIPANAGLKVLLAEDDPVNALLIRATLTRAGHAVTTVEDFNSLMEAAIGKAGRPDILITDLSMPGGNGLDAIEAIRSFEDENELPELPIIIVSGRSGDEIRSQALVAGASEFLTKPADPTRLSELVSAFGNSSRRHA